MKHYCEECTRGIEHEGDEYCCGGDDDCASIDPEPACVEGLTHRWYAGTDWSGLGTAMQHRHICRYCGVVRIEIAHGWQRGVGQCDEVSYKAGVPDRNAIRAELRRRRRRHTARRYRERIAVSVYGSVEAWREAVRRRRAEVLARNVRAARARE
jgi:hypothetical protein